MHAVSHVTLGSNTHADAYRLSHFSALSVPLPVEEPSVKIEHLVILPVLPGTEFFLRESSDNVLRALAPSREIREREQRAKTTPFCVL